MHSGLALNVFGSSPEVVRKHAKKAPKFARKTLRNSAGIRVSFGMFRKPCSSRPRWRVPDVWRPVRTLAWEQSENFSSWVGVGLTATYAYVQSDDVIGGKATHFLRPGIRAGIDLKSSVNLPPFYGLEQSGVVPQNWEGSGSAATRWRRAFGISDRRF